jgi:hypothetical protein
MTPERKRFVEKVLIAVAVLGTFFGGMYCWMAMVYVIDRNWLVMKEMPANDRDAILMSAQAISFLSFFPTAIAVVALVILLRLRKPISN